MGTHFYSYAHTTTLFVSLARVYIYTHTHTHTHSRKGLRAHRETTPNARQQQQQLFCSVFARGVVERKKKSREKRSAFVKTTRRNFGLKEEEEDPIASCSVDEPETCSLADLEILYVDALWNYYNDGKFTLSDTQYDRIREELNWQGSGFPTLRRDEIQFVQAAIAYSRGEKIMGDEEYEELKRKIKTDGKRRDVTALLLYTKGQQLLDSAQFELMSEEMMKLGIDVGMKGATCTLSKTPTTLENDTSAVAKMYGALALIPFLIGLAPTIFFDILGLHVDNGLALGFATTLAAILTYKLAEYTELNNAQILTGQCPCCEEPFKQLFSGQNGVEKEMEYKCKVCGTTCSLNREKKLIVTSGPFAI